MDNADTIRHAILLRIGDLHPFSVYKLAQLVKGEMCQATVYNFIYGTTDIGTKKASALMKVLGLVLTVGESK